MIKRVAADNLVAAPLMYKYGGQLAPIPFILPASSGDNRKSRGWAARRWNECSISRRQTVEA